MFGRTLIFAICVTVVLSRPGKQEAVANKANENEPSKQDASAEDPNEKEDGENDSEFLFKIFFSERLSSHVSTWKGDHRVPSKQAGFGLIWVSGRKPGECRVTFPS